MLRHIVVLVGTIGVVGCIEAPPSASSSSDEPLGSLAVELVVGASRHDLTAIRYEIVPADSSCGDPPLYTQTRSLEEESLPISLGDGAAGHLFADAFFVLEPGEYRVCALPLHGEEPSSECAPAEMVVTAQPELTTEVLLVSQCEGEPSSAVDVIVELNDPPVITAVTLDPSKFVTVCETLTITVEAEDPNGDELNPVYDFQIVSSPGTGALLDARGPVATLAGSPGDYVIEVKVFDSHGQPASLSFPVYISAATCAVPPDVYAVLEAKCSPCHTTGSSGGLSLATPELAYERLVGRPSASAACSTRTLVSPRAPESSYLVAKLRGAPEICGTIMPRGRPALPEAELVLIEDWIRGLPFYPTTSP